MWAVLVFGEEGRGHGIWNWDLDTRRWRTGLKKSTLSTRLTDGLDKLDLPSLNSRHIILLKFTFLVIST